MNISGLERSELEKTLHNLELVRDAKRQEMDAWRRQQRELEVSLRTGGTALQNLDGSILAIREALGLEVEGQGILVMQEAHPDSDHFSEAIDKSRAIMLIVARHHDRGGIGFEQIYKIAQEEGLGVDREYLRTVTNRKRARQRKLAKRDGKWFLTDKGKEELGIRD